MTKNMTRNQKRALLVATVLVVAMATSACEIDVLPVVDCSGINQPDMGGLVCLGMNAFALSAGVIALIAALVLGVGSAIPA
jgi:hypothetical protein